MRATLLSLLLASVSTAAIAQDAPPPGEPAPAPAPAPAPEEAPAPKAPRGEPAMQLMIGVSGDIGIFIRGLTIGTGGLGVYGSTGLGGVGGKAFVQMDNGVRLGAEGGVDWDFMSGVDSEWWFVGGLVGFGRPVAKGRFAGASLGIGYGEGREKIYDFKQTSVYFRPRTSMLVTMGPIGAEFAIFAQLPIVLSQTLEGRDSDYGWTPWAGVELTLYFVKGLGG